MDLLDPAADGGGASLALPAAEPARDSWLPGRSRRGGGAGAGGGGGGVAAGQLPAPHAAVPGACAGDQLLYRQKLALRAGQGLPHGALRRLPGDGGKGAGVRLPGAVLLPCPPDQGAAAAGAPQGPAGDRPGGPAADGDQQLGPQARRRLFRESRAPALSPRRQPEPAALEAVRQGGRFDPPGAHGAGAGSGAADIEPAGHTPGAGSEAGPPGLHRGLLIGAGAGL